MASACLRETDPVFFFFKDWEAIFLVAISPLKKKIWIFGERYER